MRTTKHKNNDVSIRLSQREIEVLLCVLREGEYVCKHYSPRGMKDDAITLTRELGSFLERSIRTRFGRSFLAYLATLAKPDREKAKSFERLFGAQRHIKPNQDL